jgi:hypothetical protein
MLYWLIIDQYCLFVWLIFQLTSNELNQIIEPGMIEDSLDHYTVASITEKKKIPYSSDKVIL